MSRRIIFFFVVDFELIGRVVSFIVYDVSSDIECVDVVIFDAMYAERWVVVFVCSLLHFHLQLWLLAFGFWLLAFSFRFI